MKLHFLFTAAVCAAAIVPAHATPPTDPPGCATGQNGDVDNDPTGNGCPGDNGGGNGNGGNGGNGGGGGNANNSTTLTNTNTNDIANTLTNTNAVTSTNTNTSESNSSSVATGGSVTDSGNSSNVNENNSSAVASGGNGGSGGNSVVTVEGDTTIYRQRRIPVNTAYSPALTSGLDTCSGSFSAGGTTSIFGFSIGGTKADKTCQLIKLGREAAQMGMPDVQCQVLALDPRFNEALRRAGRSCALPPVSASSVMPMMHHQMPPVQQQVVPEISPIQPVFSTPERGR